MRIQYALLCARSYLIQLAIQCLSIPNITTMITPTFQTFNLPADTTQALVVTSADWSANSGQLQRYQKQAQHWLAVGSPMQVRLGRNGMGWGLGLQQTKSSGHTPG